VIDRDESGEADDNKLDIPTPFTACLMLNFHAWVCLVCAASQIHR
jgi:hypothetical protein